MLIVGAIAVVLGLIALAAKTSSARRLIGILLIVAGIAGVGLGIYDVSQANSIGDAAAGGIDTALAGQTGIDPATADQIKQQFEDALDISPGIGLWIIIAGGIVVLVGGGLTMASAKNMAKNMDGGGMAAPSAAAPAGSGFATGPDSIDEPPVAGGPRGDEPPPPPMPG